jgi:Protein of unknown function (DUF2971)
MRSPLLNALLSKPAPETLYHYTNQTGFLGIIRSRQMWLTHTQYLNDRREFSHAVDLAKEEVGNRLSAEPTASNKEILLAMKNALEPNVATINVCVCSFSKASDSLSQWRAYSRPSGFAIGFPSNFLREIAQNGLFYFAPCVYEEQEQRQIIRAIVDEAVEDVLNPKSESSESEFDYLERSGDLVSYLHLYAPLLKHESFKEEEEWRIISPPLFNHIDGYDFREGRSLIIPYYKLRLKDASDEFRISDVVVGPTLDEERSLNSTINFLMHEGIIKVFPPRPAPVRSSRVPYRDW